MKIKEFEQTTGLKRSTIRFYERLGLLAPDHTGVGSGYRSYTQVEVKRAIAIKQAQKLGFSLGEIRTLIHAWERGHLDKAQRIKAIAEKISEIDNKLAALAAMKVYLGHILSWVENGEEGAKPVFNALD